MSIQQTFSREPQLRTDTNQDRNISLYTTCIGSRDVAISALRAGIDVGYESGNQRPPSDIPVEFVDWPFLKLQDDTFESVFERHLQAVKEDRPEIAVAPDVDGRVSFGRILEAARELSKYAETVVMVPKTIHPSDVPRTYRVGMPCQDRFGDTPWQWPEYSGCDSVHLLGGDPRKHNEILKYWISVESVDTAVPITYANWGGVWEDGGWTYENLGYYGSIEKSFRNIRSEWNGFEKAGGMAKLQYDKPVSSYDVESFPAETLLHPDDQKPFPGRKYYYENM